MSFLLGFEVPTGKPVNMTNHHTVITGMTQHSGKTTGLEAMVERSKVKAIAFITKRGESGFRKEKYIPAYFKEQKLGNLIDWQYVSAILEATMGEKMKFERYWIIKVCKGAHSLQEVYENIKNEQRDARRALDESMYTNLAAYFEIVLPEIGRHKFANKLELSRGINVLNLVDMKDEMQQLVIESVLSYVWKRERNTVVIIPEAHKFIPQGRNTPVKSTALRLIREGAGIGNFMWVDTQETTSVDKAILKQCSNWIMGYQQERNEVQNVRENIGKRRISDEDIMSLKLGHFIALLQQEIYHVYILPAGIPEEMGVQVAQGLKPVEEVRNILMTSVKMQAVMPEAVAEEIQELRIDDQIYVPSIDQEELTRLQEVEKTYLEQVAGWESQEKAYAETIDGLREKTEQLEKEAYEADTRMDQLFTELTRYKIFEEALYVFLQPVILGTMKEKIQIDENKLEDKLSKTIEATIEKKIMALPAQKKQRIQSPVDTGIPWVDMWLPKLKTNEAKILRYMAGHHELALSKRDISIGTGISFTSSGLSGGLSKLKRWRLIEQVGNDWKLAEGPP